MTDLDRFVAPWVRRWITRQGALEPDLASPIPGAVLAADIAGFTALTEQLAARGQDGIEAIQRILNRGFERIVAVIEASGGEVLKFAGDATLAWWPARDGDVRSAVRGAVHGGLALQEAMPELAQAAGTALRLRVAIGAGDCWTAIVGGENDRWEAVLGGAPFDQLATGDDPGLVELSPAARQVIQDDCTGREGAGGRLIVEQLHARGIGPAGVPGMADPVRVRAFVPRHLAERLESGQGDWLAELRPVSVLFATTPFSATQAPDAEMLQDLTRILQRAVYQFGGSVVQYLVDDHGDLVLVAAWGVPLSSHPNDAERAVRAAHELHTRCGAAGRPCAVGVATGKVFSGLRGAASRAEYALIGKVVNRSARLMQAVRDGVWCDAPTAAAAGAVTFTEVSDVTLKGIGSLSAFAPAARATRAAAPRSTLVGRTHERAALRDVLDGVITDPARTAVVVLEGEAGVGKSALTAAFADDVRAGGVVLVTGACDPLDAGTAYGPLRGAFAALLGLDTMVGADRVPHVMALLGADARRRELAPLLAPVLHLPLPENDTTQAMSGRARSEATNALLLHLLDVTGRGTPRVMVLEDVHWMDASSWTVIEMARRQCHGWCFLLVSRPVADIVLPPSGATVLADVETRRIVLQTLDAEDIAALVGRQMGVRDVPAAVAAFVHEKAGGHPLFALAVVATLEDGGVIRREDGRMVVDAARLAGFAMPATLQGMIVSRIDRLSAPHQLVMKVASIMGRVFALEALATILPAEVRSDDLSADLAAIAEGGFLEPGDTAGEYRFVHAVVRDAAYDLLPLERRRTLHAAAAAWHDQRFPDDPRYFGRLAIHWTEAHDAERAPQALERAGDHGLRTGAYAEARDLLARLVRLTRTGFGDDPAARVVAPAGMQGRWLRKLGVAEFNLGELESGRSHLEDAAVALGDPVPVNGWPVRRALAREFARRLLPRGAAPRAADQEDETGAEIARVFRSLGAIYHVGQLSELTLYTIVRGFNLTERRGPSPELMTGLGSMIYLTTLLGRHRAAARYVARLEGLRTQLDRPLDYAEAMYAVALTDLGQGRWAACRTRAHDARDIYVRLGEQRGRMGITGLLGNLEEVTGNLEQSRAWYAELHALAEETGDAQSQAWAWGGLGMVDLREGRLAEAITTARKSGAFADQAGERVAHLSSRGTIAMACLQSGDYAAAGAMVTEAFPILQGQPRYAMAHHNLNGYESLAGAALLLWERTEAAGGNAAEWRRAAHLACGLLRRYSKTFLIGRPTAQLWTGLEHWLAGRHRRARTAWGRAIAEAAAAAIPYDLGRAHHELARHLEPGDPDRARHAALAEAVFDQLGAASAREAAVALRSVRAASPASGAARSS